MRSNATASTNENTARSTQIKFFEPIKEGIQCISE